MPKKARRGSLRYGGSRKGRKPRRVAARAQPRPEIPVETGPAQTLPRPTRTAVPVATAGQPHYGYVMSDMRRIAILVGVVAAILIVLAFLLR